LFISMKSVALWGDKPSEDETEEQR